MRFAAARPSLLEQPFEMIGALWLTGYLFALVGATVAHELTHRNNRFAKLTAYLLLGFTGNASFVIYHIYTHHRQVGTHDDAATARRGAANACAPLWRARSPSKSRKPRASRRRVSGARACPPIRGETN